MEDPQTPKKGKAPPPPSSPAKLFTTMSRRLNKKFAPEFVQCDRKYHQFIDKFEVLRSLVLASSHVDDPCAWGRRICKLIDECLDRLSDVEKIVARIIKPMKRYHKKGYNWFMYRRVREIGIVRFRLQKIRHKIKRKLVKTGVSYVDFIDQICREIS